MQFLEKVNNNEKSTKVHKTNRLLMVIFCKEIYFVSYQQIETLDSDKIVNDDFPNQ